MSNKYLMTHSGDGDDAPIKLVDLGDGTYAYSVTASSDSRDFIWQQTVAGNAFVWSTGLIAVTSLLGNIKVYITNPGTNTKNLYIHSLVADNGSASNVFGTVLYDPTTSLPTTSKGNGINQNLANTTVSGITLYADASGTAMTGGTTLPLTFAPANARTEFLGDQQVFIVTPGHKLGINVPITVAVSTNCQLILYGVVY